METKKKEAMGQLLTKEDSGDDDEKKASRKEDDRWKKCRDEEVQKSKKDDKEPSKGAIFELTGLDPVLLEKIIIKRMSFRRKTIYCKFYRPGNAKSCRNGEDCPFIHDDQGVSRRYSQSNSHDESFQKNYYTGTTIHVSHHGARTVKIDPKYKYIADRARKTTEPSTSNAISTSKNPPQPDLLQSNTPAKKEIAATDSSFYSNINDLSKEEIEHFEAEKFILGSIPLVPPPYSLA